MFSRFGKPLEKLTLNRKKKKAVKNVPRSTNAPHRTSDQIQDLGDSLKTIIRRYFISCEFLANNRVCSKNGGLHDLPERARAD